METLRFVTVEDLEEMNRLLIGVLPPPITLAGAKRDTVYFLQRWERFSQKLKQGHSLTIYDYINELNSRDILDRLCRMLTPDARSRLRAN
jgi:hypothetical protein